jgi:hypothetical protein
MEQETHLMFKEDFGLLIEAGFIAVKQLDETSATRIFNAAQVISPQSMAPRIGLGYIALNKLELKEASKIFQEVLVKEPDNMLAQVFLGITYLLLKPKRNQGEELIREAMTKATDPTIIHLAELSLEWAEKDIKTGKLRIPYDDGSKQPKQAAPAAGSAAQKNQTP